MRKAKAAAILPLAGSASAFLSVLPIGASSAVAAGRTGARTPRSCYCLSVATRRQGGSVIGPLAGSRRAESRVEGSTAVRAGRKGSLPLSVRSRRRPFSSLSALRKAAAVADTSAGRVGSTGSELGGRVAEEREQMSQSTSLPAEVSAALSALYGLERASSSLEACRPCKLCLVTSGAGGAAVSWLLGMPGASAVLLEASVPYSHSASKPWMRFIDDRPEDKSGSGAGVSASAGAPSRSPSLCSPQAAASMAKAAFHRAVQLRVEGDGLSSLDPASAEDEVILLGVGCTAAVASVHPKKGEHRCHIATYSQLGKGAVSLTLAKGRRNRAGEDDVVSRLMLQAVLLAVGRGESDGLVRDLDPTGRRAGRSAPGGGGGGGGGGEEQGMDKEEEEEEEERPQWEPTFEAHSRSTIERLLSGEAESAVVLPTRRGRGGVGALGTEDVDEDTEGREGGGSSPSPSNGRGGDDDDDEWVTFADACIPHGTLIYPGSFNPLHEGHLELVQAAKTFVLQGRRGGEAGGGDGSGGVRGVEALFEMSVSNADKGTLSMDVVVERAHQFSQPKTRIPIVLTRAPLFVDKARLFPGCVFVLGADTIARLVDPKYYNNSVVEMATALAEIQHLGCSFIVGGRLEQSKEAQAGGGEAGFLTLEHILQDSPLPLAMRESLFVSLPEESFRRDVSSSDIRRQREQHQ